MSKLDSNSIESVLSQKEQIINSTPKRKTPLANKVANVVGRRAVATAQAEVMKEVLAKLITVVYEETEDGQYWNLTRDGRIDGVTMPWGIRYKSWGVTRTHAKVLQYTMVRTKSPFVYIESSKRWFVDLEQYPTKEHAFNWLNNFNLTGDRWLQLKDTWTNR